MDLVYDKNKALSELFEDTMQNRTLTNKNEQKY